MTAIHDHEATFRNTLAAFERGDVNAILESYNEDATVVQYVDPTAQYSGRAAIEELLRGFVEDMRDPVIEVTNVLVDGDRLAGEASMRGTPADQSQPVEVRYGLFMVFRDGKIQTERLYVSQE